MRLKIGDVFQVPIHEGESKVFQFVGRDEVQLSSDVIVVFRDRITGDEDISNVVRGPMEFHAHCIIQWGVKMGLWRKIGNAPVCCDTRALKFRDAADYGLKLGEKPVEYSREWWVWTLGDEDMKYVGKLEEPETTREVGMVFAPDRIVHRMNFGFYDIPYPKIDRS